MFVMPSKFLYTPFLMAVLQLSMLKKATGNFKRGLYKNAMDEGGTMFKLDLCLATKRSQLSLITAFIVVKGNECVEIKRCKYIEGYNID